MPAHHHPPPFHRRHHRHQQVLVVLAVLLAWAMISFSSPILCVAPDVVQELDGQDAIYSLWNGMCFPLCLPAK